MLHKNHSSKLIYASASAASMETLRAIEKDRPQGQGIKGNPASTRGAAS